MKSRFITAFVVLAALCGCDNTHEINELRAPAYPLVTIDPFVSTWSAADHLYDVQTTHWTGSAKPMEGVITVDGTDYRFMGADSRLAYMVCGKASDAGWRARYTFTTPATGWERPEYDDSSWPLGDGAFGDADNRPDIGTDWKGGSVWIRRTFTLDADELDGEFFLRHRDREECEYYINGVLALFSGLDKLNQSDDVISDEAGSLLHEGENVIAVHCTNREHFKAQVEFGLYRNVTTKSTCGRTAEQIYADVQATQTHYRFNCGPVALNLTFSAPLYDLKDLELVSRPVNYVSYNTESLDGRAHDVTVRVSVSPWWGSNFPSSDIVEEEFDHDGMHFYKSGTLSQNILGRKGDRVCIDWGYCYFAVPEGNTGRKGHFLIGYDDIYSVQYFGQNLRPYWNRNSDRTILDEFSDAEKDYSKVIRRCDSFDREMFAEAARKGGRKYAELCALAYRQAITAHKLVQLPGGEICLLSKENDSNGSIGTVDVTYPSAPIFLKYNPDLAMALMNHIYDYSESGRWTKAFPAHDVGTYPLANGQTYPADMPVEEAGNMIILTAAACAEKGDYSYARQHWDTISTWVGYLVNDGVDPADQLCTDDFAGRLSRNANLSAKAIMGIACYGLMAGELGDSAAREEYMSKAREAARLWMTLADRGDHYGLVFESDSDSWSQKYNLVWDRLLGLNIFPDEVAQKEISYYLTKQNRYGLPLDNRKNYTKSDWIIWTAAMADSLEDFEAFVLPEWNFYNETTDRVPMTDWYNTDEPTYQHFIARSVVGGYFIKML